MIRDPYYKKIIAGLKEKLDPDTFEMCAVELIRPDLPSIVPIRGGTDSGMDGAIADGEGEPYPLISTVGEDVIGNLTRNLDSYLEKGRKRRKVIVATSQELTQRKRTNLEDRAKEKGFILVQIYDREAIAERLYRNQRYCNELLGISGSPSALSVMPVSKRLQRKENRLIGREKDLEWLKNSEGDLLIWGQPGSGKTFLVYIVALKNNGLFIVNKDLSLIANEVREKKPNFIIFDDAHIDKDFLTNMIHLRTEINATFRIIATCWPSYRTEILEILHLSSSQVKELELLEEIKIVEIIKSLGIYEPIRLVRDLVKQARGRPGLAVTLVDLCLKGDIQKVVKGEAIYDNIKVTLKPIINDKEIDCLACFAIGGKTGAKIKTISEFLNIPIIEVREIITKLAYGGVITEIDKKLIAVTPWQLRAALVKEVFFKGATSLEPDKLIDNTIYYDNSLITLIQAKIIGADIDHNWLFNLVSRSESTEVWATYCNIGKNESQEAIKIHPEMLIDIAMPALYKNPEFTIPFLLKAAINDNRSLSSTPEHPLRLIEQWIKSAVPGNVDLIIRRKILLKAVENWIKAGGDTKVGLRALEFVFLLTFQAGDKEPGTENYIITPYIFTIEGLKNIKSFWPLAFKIIKSLNKIEWQYILPIVRKFVYPGRFNVEFSDDFRKTLRQVAIEMILDISDLTKGNPAVLQQINKMAKDIDYDLKVDLDQDFEVLFPVEPVYSYNPEELLAKVRILAESWIKLTPEQIAKKLSSYENQVEAIKRNIYNYTIQYLCEVIYDKVEDKIRWIEALIKSGCSSYLIEAVLKKAAVDREKGWEPIAESCLKDSALKSVGISIIFTISSPPEHLLEIVIDMLDDTISSSIYVFCLRNQVTEATLIKLLNHPNHKVSSKAALGIYESEPQSVIPNNLFKQWEKAILTISDDEHEWILSNIFKKYHSTAFEWLKFNIAEQIDDYYKSKEIFKAAIKVLEFEHRVILLKMIPDNNWFGGEVAAYIVDNNPDLLKELMSIKDSKTIKLSSLTIDINNDFDISSWIVMAKVALNKGYTPEEIASIVRPNYWSWWGKPSERWKKWIEIFTKIAEYEDPQISQIGTIGITSVKPELDEALEKEKKEAIFGRE